MQHHTWQTRPGLKPAAERDIVRELITNLISSGHTITVNDGIEDVTGPTTDKNEVFEALAGTDSNILTATDASGNHAGWTLLVFGNSPWEVIADYTMNLEPIIQPALDRAEESERWLTRTHPYPPAHKEHP